MCVNSIRRQVKRLFPNRKKVAIVGGGDTGVGVAAAAAAAEEKKHEKKKRPAYRMANTSRGGPNMPKYQPCPERGKGGHVCGKGAKRISKTMGGANYQHGNHQSFFVRAA